MSAPTVSTAERDAKRLAGKLATAQARTDAIRVELEDACAAMRDEGRSLEYIGRVIGMSRVGILKMMRRRET